MAKRYLQLESGVVLPPQEGADYAAVRRALKRHDDRLELGQVGGVWKVWLQKGDQPAEFVTDWRNPDNTPRPLVFGLVDKVMAMDRNSRERLPTADELEEKRREEAAKHHERQVEALIEDTKKAKISTSLPRTKNRGNHRWKEEQLQAQQRRRSKGLRY